MSDEDNTGLPDEFDAIVNGQTDEVPEINTLWDAIKAYFPKTEGGIFIKGVLILDMVNSEGHRYLKWSVPGDVPDWDVRGMIDQAHADLNSETTAMILNAIMGDGEDD